MSPMYTNYMGDDAWVDHIYIRRTYIYTSLAEIYIVASSISWHYYFTIVTADRRWKVLRAGALFQASPNNIWSIFIARISFFNSTIKIDLHFPSNLHRSLDLCSKDTHCFWLIKNIRKTHVFQCAQHIDTSDHSTFNCSLVCEGICDLLEKKRIFTPI